MSKRNEQQQKRFEKFIGDSVKALRKLRKQRESALAAVNERYQNTERELFATIPSGYHETISLEADNPEVVTPTEVTDATS